MPRKYTDKVRESNRKWDAANLDRMSIALPKGSREAIKAHAAARGESVNAFITRAIREAMERDAMASGDPGQGIPTGDSDAGAGRG